MATKLLFMTEINALSVGLGNESKEGRYEWIEMEMN